MSELKPGDLAVVVRDCCGHWLGAMFCVQTIGAAENIWCNNCGYVVKRGTEVVENALPGRMIWAPSAWLKKIPPLTDDEDTGIEVVTHQEDMAML